MSDALQNYYKWAEGQDTYDPESWDIMIALAQTIETLQDQLELCQDDAKIINRLTAEVERLKQALTELREEIIPNWSKREAIAFIDETIGSEHETDSI